ncbi:forkhead box protein O6-like isoform 1-T1 [Geothlypis trichas]
MEEKLQAHQVEIDPDFEPQSRPRSCTWPLPHPDLEEEDGGAGGTPALAAGGDGAENAAAPVERRVAAAPPPPHGADVGQLRKAKTSRRNAWGNLSYADLITKAIESSPEKRLTLSQIYDWMVRYVPYFKDKGDSNSSAGWKFPITETSPTSWRLQQISQEFPTQKSDGGDFWAPQQGLSHPARADKNYSIPLGDGSPEGGAKHSYPDRIWRFCNTSTAPALHCPEEQQLPLALHLQRQRLHLSPGSLLQQNQP